VPYKKLDEYMQHEQNCDNFYNSTKETDDIVRLGLPGVLVMNFFVYGYFDLNFFLTTHT